MKETISLAYNDIASGGTSDKVYHLTIEQAAGFTGLYNVSAQYGRRGGNLATDLKTKKGPVPYEDAKKIFDKTLREKTGKGYLPVNTPTPATPIAEVVTDPEWFSRRPQELLEEINNPEPYLTDPAYWMQDKSDGVSRGVVKLPDGKIIGYNKTGGIVPLPAELHAELQQLPLKTFNLDGELVGQKLICRDLIDADGDVASLPYSKRFDMLAGLLEYGAFTLLSAVTTWKTQREKLLALQRQKNERREGVAFKLITAPHRSGRNGQHKKFKFIKSLSAIAGEPRAKGKDSVEIFLLDGRELVPIGTVSLIGKPAVNQGDIVEVKYLYAYPSKKVVQARIDRLRDDVKREECLVSQLIMKREED